MVSLSYGVYSSGEEGLLRNKKGAKSRYFGERCGDEEDNRSSSINTCTGHSPVAYKVGWRVSEITSLTWSQVDLHQGIERLEVGETKNDEGRTVYLDEELKEVFKQQREAQKKSGKLLPYVFLNKNGDNRMKRFDKAWKEACKKAKIGEAIIP